MSEDEVQRLNELAGRLANIATAIEQLEKDIIEGYGLKENDYLSPVRSWKFNQALEESRRDLTKFAAKKLAAVPDVVDTKEVEREFDHKDFDAQAIKDFVKEQFDAKADELALEELKKTVGHLLIYGEWNDQKQRRERSVPVQGNRLRFHRWLDWFYGKPSRLYELIDELNALERFAWVVLKQRKPSEALNLPTSFWRYNRDIAEENLTQKQDFHGIIKAVKIHKNGSIYVWLGSQIEAQKLAEALTAD